MPAAFASSAVVIGSNPITRIPNAFMRTPTSRPMRPSPRMASVLPYSSEPEYSFRSQRPSFMLVAAWQMGRASAPIRKHVSSHAEIELPPGVLFGRGKWNGKLIL
uniref:Uncharacterized protein n=1 Tax=Anopheles merus TaxID=30066 RepID=A0A182VFN2_ANOME